MGRRLRFEGYIVGAGTDEGTRLVLGNWLRTPHGAFSDVMIQRPDGLRILIAPDAWVADFVASTYNFDQVLLHPVEVRRFGLGRRSVWWVKAGALDWGFTVGRRSGLGSLLRIVPKPVMRSHSFARLTNLVAPVLLPGVRTLGSAGHGRVEWYAAHDFHELASSNARWEGKILGRLSEVFPPPTFGFGSTPRRPGVTTVTSTVLLP